MNKQAHEEGWSPPPVMSNKGMQAGMKARLAAKNPALFVVGSILNHERNLRKMSSVTYGAMADELQKIAFGAPVPPQPPPQQQGMGLGKKLMIGAGLGAAALGTAGVLRGRSITAPGTAMHATLSNNMHARAALQGAGGAEALKIVHPHIQNIGGATYGAMGAAAGLGAGALGAGVLHAVTPNQPAPVPR